MGGMLNFIEPYPNFSRKNLLKNVLAKNMYFLNSYNKYKILWPSLFVWLLQGNSQ